ncbi:MAG: 1-deoxy-D-xylulose-5-phosphate synthase N-terminal domain-containing protein [Acutalibacteraceae bacterium]
MFKRLLVSENLFELLGRNTSPVDGNDLSRLNAVLREAKSMEKPCVVHVCTTKGKGYPGAERRPDTYHSVGAFDKSCGVDPDGCCTGFSALFGELMCARAQADPALAAITAAMCDGTGLCGFRKAFPDRFYDVGIAEEHALTFAAGLAAAGAHPVLAVYSSFCQRCFDQILHDAALPALPVVLAVDRAGLVCADGPTHHGVFDVSFLRGVPGMTVYSPETASELRESFEKAFAAGAPAAVRYPKSGDCPDEAETYTVCAGGDVKYRDFGSPKPSPSPTDGWRRTSALPQRRPATRVIKLIKIHPIDQTLAPLLDGARLAAVRGRSRGGIAEESPPRCRRPADRIRAIRALFPTATSVRLKSCSASFPSSLPTICGA